MADQRTDPAREMAALIDYLRGLDTGVASNQQPPSNWQTLSQGLKLKPNSAEFLELLSVVRARLARLDVFVIGLDDPAVGKDVIEHVRDAIQRFANAFNPRHLNHPWPDVLKNWIVASDATSFRMFSPTMARYLWSKRLSDAEREEALLTIREAIDEIKIADDLGAWEQQALVHGYKRLELILTHFEFFGHEGLTREIVLTTSATRAVAENLEPTSSALKKAWAALLLAAKIVEVVAAPSVAHQALEDYYHLLRLGGPKPSEIRMLPAPERLDPQSEEGVALESVVEA
jgi:hypothetical protein